MIPPFAPIHPRGESPAVWLGGAVTGNLATTVCLGLITFVVMNVAGIKWSVLFARKEDKKRP